MRSALVPSHTPSIGGLGPPSTDTHVVLCLTDLSFGIRYINTCYAALVQCANGSGNLEVLFQMLPASGLGPRERVFAVPGLAPPAASSSARVNDGDELHVPQMGPFSKVWLQPDDVGVVFGLEKEQASRVLGRMQSSKAAHGGLSHRRTSSGFSHSDPANAGAGLRPAFSGDRCVHSAPWHFSCVYSAAERLVLSTCVDYWQMHGCQPVDL